MAEQGGPAARAAPAPPSRPRPSASARGGPRRGPIRVVSVSWPTAEISGIVPAAAARHHRLLVERPQILETAAAAGDDQQGRDGARGRAPGGR